MFIVEAISVNFFSSVMVGQNKLERLQPHLIFVKNTVIDQSGAPYNLQCPKYR
jgi:hypothetical protein